MKKRGVPFSENTPLPVCRPILWMGLFLFPYHVCVYFSGVPYLNMAMTSSLAITPTERLTASPFRNMISVGILATRYC